MSCVWAVELPEEPDTPKMKPPPAPVQEVPPDQQPQGANVQWIPGYWAWDDSRNDYIWGSGFWRDLPPGRHWVPFLAQIVERQHPRRAVDICLK